jgi:Tfp pilus assembly protein PilF
LSKVASTPLGYRVAPLNVASLMRIALAPTFAVLALLSLGSCGDDPKPAATTAQAPPLSDSDVKLGIALNMRQSGRFQEALGLFEQILAVDPDNEKAQFNRATVYADLGRTNEALAEFDRLVQLHPDDTDILTNRGVVLMQVNRLDEALASVDKALSIQSGRIPTRLLRAQVLTKMTRYDDALKELDVAKSMQPNAVEADLGRASVFAAQGNGAAAEAIYNELLTRFPGEPRLKAMIDAQRSATVK